MGIKRYELTDGQWSRISGLLPGKVGDPGRSGEDNRQFVSGCLWVLRSGAHWCDLPERYGKWKGSVAKFAGRREMMVTDITADVTPPEVRVAG